MKAIYCKNSLMCNTLQAVHGSTAISKLLVAFPKLYCNNFKEQTDISDSVQIVQNPDNSKGIFCFHFVIVHNFICNFLTLVIH